MTANNKYWCLAFIFTALVWTTCASARTENIHFFAKFPNFDLSQWYVSHGWANGEHQSCEWRSDAVRATDEKNIRLILSDNGGKERAIGCGEIQSKKRFGFGRYEARMRTAAGPGLNSAFFTYTGPPHGVDEHDEIDFEFLGKDPHKVELNYHTNGESQGPIIIDLGFDATQDFHDYAFEWTPDKIRWYVDGKFVAETPKNAKIPRNAGKILFSLWSGAKSSDDWLGKFKYKAPVTAEVEWVKFTPLPNKLSQP